MRCVIGLSSGKWDAIMFVSSWRETLLNILVRSAKMAARLGRCLFFCGCLMNLSTDKNIALIMKSMPPFTPTAKLKGKRYCANLSFIWIAMCVAIIRRIAVGMPMGRNFRKSF